MARTSQQRTGSRIRARRLDLGLRQADLAQATGISPSYLNLIEHNKRRIAGGLLDAVAKVLDVPAELLTEGASSRVLNAMREAASAMGPGPELDKLDEMAARYPGWAKLVADQQGRITALEAQTQILTDRITYDPAVATALHGMISAVTAIRSTASILTSGEVLDADWLSRFHGNIHKDAMRLAEESEALIGFLDAPEDAGSVPLSPLEEAERWLQDQGWHIPAWEQGQPAPETARLRPAAQTVLTRMADLYMADANLLPMKLLESEIAQTGYHPWEIAAKLNVPLDCVIRRFAALPGAEHPPFGLVICDAGGFPIVLKEVTGFAFPRGTACPLWPVYTALGQPGRPVQAVAELPGEPITRATCTTVATQSPPAAPGQPPLVSAVMLVQPNAATPAHPVPVIPVGTACRICPRNNCPTRREPSALSTG